MQVLKAIAQTGPARTYPAMLHTQGDTSIAKETPATLLAQASLYFAS